MVNKAGVCICMKVQTMHICIINDSHGFLAHMTLRLAAKMVSDSQVTLSKDQKTDLITDYRSATFFNFYLRK